MTFFDRSSKTMTARALLTAFLDSTSKITPLCHFSDKKNFLSLRTDMGNGTHPGPTYKRRAGTKGGGPCTSGGGLRSKNRSCQKLPKTHK